VHVPAQVKVDRQIGVGIAPRLGADDPDLPAAQRVTQRPQHAQLVGDPLDAATSAGNRATVAAQNTSSAIRFAEPMMRFIRPGGSSLSARHRASTASRCRSSFSSLGQTCSASQAIILSSSPRGNTRNPSASRICARCRSALRPATSNPGISLSSNPSWRAT
jgi:hypothetical protein